MAIARPSLYHSVLVGEKEVASIATVKVATVDDTGALAGPATKGLHVYLAPPSKDGLKFDFVHRVIGDDGDLGVALPTNTNYWCFWASKALEETTIFRARDNAFDRPSGFPLPTQWKGGKLCLPEPRKLTLNVWDFSGVNASDPADQANQKSFLEASVKKFYSKLLIDIDLQMKASPPGAPTNVQFLFSANKVAGQKPTLANGNVLAQLVNGTPQPIDPQPDLSQLLTATDPKKTVHLLFCDRFLVLNAIGVAWPTMPITRKSAIQGEVFTRPSSGLFIMVRSSTFTATEPVPHELAHCLLHDPGLGKVFLENTLGGTLRNGRPDVEAFLRKLNIGVAYADLFESPHDDNPSGNLMSKKGGTGLRPIQIAIIRSAHELTPSAGLMPSPP